MTFKGWIGYLRCMFSKHQLYTVKRGSKTELLCRSCVHPYDLTFKQRLLRLHKALTTPKPRNDNGDDYPF